MVVIGAAVLFFVVLGLIIVLTHIARKNEDKKEQEKEIKEQGRDRKLNALPQEIAQSIRVTLGIKTTLADEVVEAYKRLKSMDEQESTNTKKNNGQGS